jgi:hypothetical protein
MELPIDKITNKQLELQLDSSKNDMNSLSIILSYDFAIEFADLNWYDILFAIDNEYMTNQAAVEYAVSLFVQNEVCPQTVIDLICLSPNEVEDTYSLRPYIAELASEVSEQKKGETKQKLLYLILQWNFDQQTKYVDPLCVVEIIYADFGHPKNISHFVRYMPMIGPDLGSLELNIKRIFNNWREFLERQKALYKR